MRFFDKNSLWAYNFCFIEETEAQEPPKGCNNTLGSFLRALSEDSSS
jgi:hypothetical protein